MSGEQRLTAALPRAPRRYIDWQSFYDFGDGEVKPNKQSPTATLRARAFYTVPIIPRS